MVYLYGYILSMVAEIQGDLYLAKCSLFSGTVNELLKSNFQWTRIVVSVLRLSNKSETLLYMWT